MKKLMLAVLLFALVAFAASKTYHVTFDSNAWIGATEVKAGDYKVQVDGGTAILKSGKKAIQVPAKLETAERPFAITGVVITTIDGKPQVQAIQIGGTTDRIVFAFAIPTGY
jgi:hypothetical protein